MRVAKSDGSIEEFKEEKLLSSLRHAGASDTVAIDIAAHIRKDLYPGITTHEIYSRAFANLRGTRKESAARYSLKRAVLEFGPSGFPFEAYIAQLFMAEGFEASIDQIVQGACVEHEVDVVVKKLDATIYGEAKFHNTLAFKTDLKVALYVKARIDDIRAAGRPDARGLIVTNTKFTDKALEYASCQGLELLSWDYPQGQTLHERIDRARLYPVTALTTLSKREKMALLQDKIVLCAALPKDTDALSRAGIPHKRVDTVLEEVGALCIPGRDI